MLKRTSAQLAHRKHEIAQRIRQARRQRGWTQEQIAELLGCSRKRYNSMERGRTELRAIEIDLLAEALNVPVGFFFEKAERQEVSIFQG
jgi:transcriptional regulator with XRE-family HTH domain